MEGILNLPGLRKKLLLGPRQTDFTLDTVTDSPEAFHLTRRQALKLAGLAVGTAVGITAVEKTLTGPFELVESRRRVAFKLGGEERWIIDTRNFGGNPSLKVIKTKDLTRVELKNAKFPGTGLPADLVCELKQGIVGCWMKLTLGFGGFAGEVPFEKWLAGTETLRSGIKMSAPFCELATRTALWLSGRATAEYFPDWTLQVEGPKAVKLVGFGPDIISDSVTIAPLGTKEPSILSKPATRRTLITLNRGEREWPLMLSPDTVEGWKLAADGSTFDVINVETGESRGGYTTRAFVAESGQQDAKLSFQMDGRSAGHQDKPFELPLRRARYAVAFEPSGFQTALLADYDKDPVWLHTDGYSVQLGDAPGNPPFELVGQNGKIVRGYCSPALLGMAAPLPDAIVETTRFAEGARLTLLSTGDIEGSSLNITTMAINPNISPVNPNTSPTVGLNPNIGSTIKPGLVDVSRALPNSFTVSVVRPDDLLVLKFEFINLKLQGTNLVPVNGSDNSYIIVHFPPQSIAEQAFYENPDAGVQQPTTSPENSRNEANPGSGDPLPAGPAASLISGPSRLAFRVPKEVTQIPYTLKDLLDWTKYLPSVMLTAKPPEEDWVTAELAVLKFAGGDAKFFDAVVQPKIVPPKLIPAIPVIPQPGPGPVINPVRSMGAVGPGETRAEAMVIERTPNDTQPKDTRIGIIPIGTITPTVPNKDMTLIAPKIPPEMLLSQDIIGEPLEYQTAIEMPYRLILSPHFNSGWKHSVVPVNHNIIQEPVELWHTRLGVRDDQGNVDEKNERMRTLRAIWSPDYVAPPDGSAEAAAQGHVNSPFRMSLDSRDRHEIVRLTADFHIKTDKQYKPLPIEAEQFMLTALGAWMKSRGAWDPPNSTELEVESWQHKATMGRDHYVKVVYRGYLFPFGHRASLIKVTERKFQKSGGLSGTRTAFLRQRMYIVVREPEKLYPKSNDRRGRQIPFRRVQMKTVATPSLAEPGAAQCRVGSYGQQGFWPCVGNNPFMFHMVSEDWQGQTCEFSAPLIFVGKEYATNSSKKTDMDTISAAYSSSTRRKADLAGQKVAYAECDKPGDTTLETVNILFGAEIPASGESLPPGQPRFFPTLFEASVRMPEVAAMSGSDTGTVAIKLPEAFLNSGFDAGANKGAVFAEISGASKPNISFQGDKSGALAKPNLSISGLSRVFGPVGGALDNLMGGAGGAPSFKPADFFTGDAGLFGGFKLSDILPDIPLGDVLNDALNIGKVPGLKVTYDYDPSDILLKVPTGVTIVYDWKPKVREFTLGGIVSFNPKEPEKTLALHAELKKNLRNLPEEPKFKTKTDIKNFTVDFIDVIAVEFNSLTFAANSGEKPDVDVDIKNVQFKGCLEFVNELRDLLKSSGSGPYIDIQASGVEAGISVALPNVALGMFSLQNMTLSSRIVIPFTSNPVTLYFAFCSRENPFLLSVGPFGGGGFFQMAINMNGIQLIEASFEFGATMSFGIAGLASGKVYIMGGVYFRWEPAGLQFTAYFKMGGALRILGIITVSVEFYMELSYLSKGLTGTGRAVLKGMATLTIEIEILFFSTSVELSVEREFDAGDPKFTQQVDKDHWIEYCEAFA